MSMPTEQEVIRLAKRRLRLLVMRRDAIIDERNHCRSRAYEDVRQGYLAAELRVTELSIKQLEDIPIPELVRQLTGLVPVPDFELNRELVKDLVPVLDFALNRVLDTVVYLVKKALTGTDGWSFTVLIGGVPRSVSRAHFDALFDFSERVNVQYGTNVRQLHAVAVVMVIEGNHVVVLKDNSRKIGVGAWFDSEKITEGSGLRVTLDADRFQSMDRVVRKSDSSWSHDSMMSLLNQLIQRVSNGNATQEILRIVIQRGSSMILARLDCFAKQNATLFTNKDDFIGLIDRSREKGEEIRRMPILSISDMEPDVELTRVAHLILRVLPLDEGIDVMLDRTVTVPEGLHRESKTRSAGIRLPEFACHWKTRGWCYDKSSTHGLVVRRFDDSVESGRGFTASAMLGDDMYASPPVRKTVDGHHRMKALMEFKAKCPIERIPTGENDRPNDTGIAIPKGASVGVDAPGGIKFTDDRVVGYVKEDLAEAIKVAAGLMTIYFEYQLAASFVVRVDLPDMVHSVIKDVVGCVWAGFGKGKTPPSFRIVFDRCEDEWASIKSTGVSFITPCKFPADLELMLKVVPSRVIVIQDKRQLIVDELCAPDSDDRIFNTVKLEAFRQNNVTIIARLIGASVDEAIVEAVVTTSDRFNSICPACSHPAWLGMAWSCSNKECVNYSP